MLKPWRIIQNREVLSVHGRLSVSIETIELPDGRVIDDYWQIRTADYVKIVAETAEGAYVCLRQYRHGARRVGLTLPAGQIDGVEQPLEAAQRELLEETGYTCRRWYTIGTYPLHGNQHLCTGYYFRAEEAVKVQDTRSDDLEESSVELLSRKQLLTAFTENMFLVASDAAAVGLALARY